MELKKTGRVSLWLVDVVATAAEFGNHENFATGVEDDKHPWPTPSTTIYHVATCGDGQHAWIRWE